jgi:UDP-N-acetylmuramoylalanine--D-glutamate ligase
MAQIAVIAGLGATGLSVVRHLLARGWQVRVTDTRAEPPGLDALKLLQPSVIASLGALDTALLNGAQCLVVSPGLARTGPFFERALALGVPVLGDIELFARAHGGRVAAITGTNGKSTVTSLLAHMAATAGVRVRAGGNLGPPALQLLEGEAAELYVLELSSYQLETTLSLQLAAATVLNVTPDHMDRYADLHAYAAAKSRIFKHCAAAVVNLDDPLTAAMPTPGQRVTGFSLQQAAADWGLVQQEGQVWLARRGESLLPLNQLRIGGLHNAANALAALALGDALGLPMPAMLDALRSFKGLPHRAAWVADVNGVRYINDSKGTNVGATLAAVAGYDGPLLLILGGDGKQQDFAPLRAALAGKLRLALLIGRDAALIAQALNGACPLQHCESLEQAVQAAAQAAQPGDTVLLSPACASLDMFRDYSHRGSVFADAVARLAA